ncbi:S-adenosyl-L-methionine-dependent methyltransferase [Lentzea sp. NBRC 105346]|uniref:class I SAM-dependent methyltransferase n=1 Tax=Lentzea sp. NBRC 105346 TaxID=3032205 RepID=UPI0024A01BF1|nr:SAM-dependent methyltransferase [Lentzea sp. NBRC 105346]GLZ31235.1 S-adenosyl-L-methionine-dependent methyltransferase [Lentzea sp. NBRC 105346]
MEAVSQTARWTAAARALESEREDALFTDEHARKLAGDTGFELLKRYAGAGTAPFIAIRTRYMDDAIMRAASTVRQVVFVAAGMDTRVLRLPWPDDLVIYELDRPALLDAKAELLRGARSKPVPVDLAEEWTGALCDAGFRKDLPTLWVAEGLLFFLTEECVRALLRDLAALSAPGSVLVSDMTSAASLKNPFARSFLRALSEDGAPWRFGTDDPEGLLLSCGWQVEDLREPGQEGANFGRWDYPVVPREVPDVPRSFLFTARV